MSKATDAFDKVKNLIYLVSALGVATVFMVGFLSVQNDKKQIEKLHSDPGWNPFQVANSKIDSEDSLAGYGNTTEATQYAKALATALQLAEKENFVMEKSSSGGRSKLGKVISAVDSANAGTGKFQTFLELRADRMILLIHVPELFRYKGENREAMRKMCWRISRQVLSALAKKKSEMLIVMGLRDKTAYDRVFEGTSSSAETKVTSENFPCHKVLIKHFGTRSE